MNHTYLVNPTEVRVDLVRNDGVVPDPLWPCGGRPLLPGASRAQLWKRFWRTGPIRNAIQSQLNMFKYAGALSTRLGAARRLELRDRALVRRDVDL